MPSNGCSRQDRLASLSWVSYRYNRHRHLISILIEERKNYEPKDSCYSWDIAPDGHLLARTVSIPTSRQQSTFQWTACLVTSISIGIIHTFSITLTVRAMSTLWKCLNDDTEWSVQHLLPTSTDLLFWHTWNGPLNTLDTLKHVKRLLKSFKREKMVLWLVQFAMCDESSERFSFNIVDKVNKATLNF